MPGELTKAICKVMKEVRYVQKTGNNQHHKYRYVSDADLLNKLQPAMAEAGLSMVPSNIVATTTAHGEKRWRTDIIVTYTLSHESGETMTVASVGSGVDNEDKGAYKALTGAFKYALRQAFLVPTGTDPEDDGGVTEENEHDPSWAADQKRFFARLSEQWKDVPDAKNYETLKRFLASIGKPKPSSMTQEAREKLLTWLGDAGSERYLNFVEGR